MRRFPLTATLAFLLAATGVRAAEVVLVENGQSDYVITIPNPAPEPLRYAAEELARYVERMTGARLPIRQPTGDPPAKSIVLLSTLPAPAAGEAPRLFVVDGQRVVIGAGSGGALTSAYLFLDALGCRFLAPQLGHYHGSSEVVPKATNLTFRADQQPPAHPRLSYRKLYVEEGISHDAESLKQIVEWMPKVGYNVLVVPTDYQGSGRVKWDNWRETLTPELRKRGITIEVGGHGYQNFLNPEMEGGKLFEQHPEWFGADEKGARRKQKSRVFCTSNDEAVAYVIRSFLAYIKDRPEIQIFDFWPPDGARWCECGDCTKLGEPPDRQAILLRQVKQAVNPVRPDLKLEVIAYSSYLLPPKNEKVDEDVLIDFCPISQHFTAQINDPADEKNRYYADALLAWRKQFGGDVSIYSYYRKYAWDSLPVVIPHYMQKDLQWYAAVPVQGVSTYAEPGDWFTYELNHYALAHLAWDPDADVGALVTKFCVARYGRHAEPARAALETLGKVVRHCGSVPYTPLKSAEELDAAQKQVARAADEVKSAETSATTPDTKHNLRRLGLMCEYALRDLKVQQMRAENEPRDKVRAAASDVYRFVESHATKGVFLRQGHRLTEQRMQTRYGVGDKKPATADVAQ